MAPLFGVHDVQNLMATIEIAEQQYPQNKYLPLAICNNISQEAESVLKHRGGAVLVDENVIL